MSSINHRLSKLERSASGLYSILVHWQMDENKTRAVECQGVRYERRSGEGWIEFLSRVKREVACQPGEICWLSAVA